MLRSGSTIFFKNCFLNNSFDHLSSPSIAFNYNDSIKRNRSNQPSTETLSYNQDGQLTEMTESTPLPAYLETSLLAAKETLESLKHPTELPVLPNDGLNEWSDWFQSSCVKYSIDEKPIFPLAFQYLTCKASQSVFEALIEQEDTFKSTMNDTARQFTTAMKDLHEWYGNISNVSHLNMLNYVNESPEIKQQQVEEVESMFKSWFPQLETLRETQKLEYQAYVLHQYQNLITPLDQVEKSPTSNKMETLNDEIVEGGSDVGEEKIEQSVEATEKPDKKMLNEVLEVNSNDEREETEEMPTEKASSLMQMGFDLSDSNSALEITHDNMVIDPKFYFSKERAVALLLEKPHVVKEHSKSKLMSKKRQPAVLMKKSSSFFNITENGRHSSTSEKSDLASKRSLSMSKVKHDDVASSLKATSSMFGKFFEKARAAFTVEDDGYEMRFQNEESVVDFANMSESFTVYCGSQQVRTMYNLQLKVSDLSSHLQIQKDRAQFIAMKGSSYQSLYSDSISGMIVPVNINTLFNYGKGSAENWDGCLKEFPKNDTNTPIFNEDMTSRSPMITGYRSILEMCHLCNISSLISPMGFANNHRKSISKTSEMIFKQAKGVFNELSRHPRIKRIPRTMIFTIPDFSDNGKTFEDVKDKLKTTFRTM
ncbi:hypothetical protein BC833DRAFT_563502 [Globomyces pollinis-pini]|nr:hypothetical protein BC833DRAFT_563502 [Globomyces pollinis-pini]